MCIRDRHIIPYRINDLTLSFVLSNLFHSLLYKLYIAVNIFQVAYRRFYIIHKNLLIPHYINLQIINPDSIVLSFSLFYDLKYINKTSYRRNMILHKYTSEIAKICSRNIFTSKSPHTPEFHTKFCDNILID